MKKILVALLACLLSSVNLSLAAWDRNFIAVNYKGFPQTIAEIDRDLALLGPHFGYIRTYNSLFGAASPENAVAGRVAAYNQAHPSTPIKVALGVALTPGNQTASQSELDQAIANAKAYPSAVNAVVVGNENFGNVTEAQLIGYINYAKAKLSGTGVAVTTCQTWGVLAGHPGLVNACSSYALANIYPYWDGPGYQGGTAAKAGADTLKNWQSRFLSDYNQLVAKYGVGKIRIGETGWPSEGSQVPVQTELDSHNPRVLGDAQQLRQVLHNLLQNAQDATETAGYTDAEHPVILKTQCIESTGRVRLSVLDCGTGFPEHILKRAFEPYVTTKTKGTGLGLAVVKKIADEHASRVDIANRVLDGKVVGAQVSLSFAIESVVPV
jgi:exo-beta-1,3-glucanase (GH17 family)